MKTKKIKSISKKKMILSIVSLFVFLFSCGISQYFIWSDLFIQEFDADVAENVIWAQASIESGTLINRDFYYNQLLPFGGNLIFTPIVQHYGVTLFALRLGMSICSILFSLGLAGFFLSFDWDFSLSLLSAGLILLFLSGTSELRDIFWSHVVHYNLSLFYLMLAFIFLKIMCREKRPAYYLGLAGFEICLILGSANDIAVVLFFSASFLFGVVMEGFLKEGISCVKNRQYLILAGKTVFGVLAGLALGRILTINASTGYADKFSLFSPADEWIENLFRFPKNWFSMFAKLPEENVSFFSSVGIKLFIRLAAALLLPVISVRSFFIFPELRSQAERIFLCVHWFICVAILFFYFFGVISNAKTVWRIIPIFFTTSVSALIVLHFDLSHLVRLQPVVQFFDLSSFAAVLLYAGICCVTVFHQSISTALWYEQGGLLKTLADQGLNYGYNLDYWFANSITVLTGEEIRVREVILDNGVLSPSYHQSNIHWYEDQPDADRYFLVCQEEEFWAHPEFADGAVATYRATQERTFTKGSVGFFIFVYDKNIFSDGKWIGG